MNCSACGISNPPGKKFCGDCGAPLQAPPPPASEQRPKPPPPRGVKAANRPKTDELLEILQASEPPRPSTLERGKRPSRSKELPAAAAPAAPRAEESGDSTAVLPALDLEALAAGLLQAQQTRPKPPPPPKSRRPEAPATAPAQAPAKPKAAPSSQPPAVDDLEALADGFAILSGASTAPAAEIFDLEALADGFEAAPARPAAPEAFDDLEALADGFEAAPARPAAPEPFEDLEALADGFEAAPARPAAPEPFDDLEALADGFEPAPARPAASEPFDDLEALAGNFEAASTPPVASEPFDDLEALAGGFEAAPATPSATEPFDDLEALAVGLEPVEASARGPSGPEDEFEDLADSFDLGAPQGHSQPSADLEDLAGGFEDSSADLAALAESFSLPPRAAPAEPLDEAGASADEFEPAASLEAVSGSEEPDPDPLAELDALAEDFGPDPSENELDALAAGLEQSFMDWSERAGDPIAPDADPALPAPVSAVAPVAPARDPSDWSDLDDLADEFADLEEPEPPPAESLEALSAALNQSAAEPPAQGVASEDEILDGLASEFEDFFEGEDPAPAPTDAGAAAEDQEDEEDRVLMEKRADLLPAKATGPTGREGAGDDAMEELADVFEGEAEWDEPLPDLPAAVLEVQAATPPPAEAEAAAPGQGLGPVESEGAGEAGRDEPPPDRASMSGLLAAEEADFLDGFAEALGVEAPAAGGQPAPVDHDQESLEDLAEEPADEPADEPSVSSGGEESGEDLEELSELLSEEPLAEAVPEAVTEAREQPSRTGGLAALFAPARAGSDTRNAPPPEAVEDEPEPHEEGGEEHPDAAELAGGPEDAGPELEPESFQFPEQSQEPIMPARPEPPPPRPAMAPQAESAPGPEEATPEAGDGAWETALSEMEQQLESTGASAGDQEPDVPATVLLPSEQEPRPAVTPRPASRRVSAGGILAKVFILLLAGGLGVGGFYGYQRWVKPRWGAWIGGGPGALPPLDIPREPVTEESLRRAIAAHPEEPSSYAALAELLEKQGKPQEAALVRSGQPKAALPAAAATAVPELPVEAKPEAGEPTPAIAPPTAAPGEADRIAELLAQGKLLEAAGKGPEAIQSYEDALRRDPLHHDALLQFGALQWKLGQLDPAFETLSRLARLHPRSGVAHNELGLVIQQQATSVDGVHKAIGTYLKALELDPGLTEAYTNLGAAYESIGDAKSALEMRRKAVELDPSNAEAHAQLGLSFLAMEQLAEAKSEIERAVALDPDEGIYHSNLGYWHVVQGKPEESLPHYRRAIELQPSNPNHFSELGSALLMLEKSDEALAAFQKAKDLAPQNAKSYYDIAFAFKAKEDLAKALDFFEQAANLAPEDSQIQLGMAGVLEGLKKTKQAIGAYKRAIQFDSCNYVASYNLASLLHNRIRFKDEAIDEWKRYLGMVERCGIQGQEEFVAEARERLKEFDY